MGTVSTDETGRRSHPDLAAVHTSNVVSDSDANPFTGPATTPGTCVAASRGPAAKPTPHLPFDSPPYPAVTLTQIVAPGQ